MIYTTMPIRMGQIHKGSKSYGITTVGFPIFGFGESLGDAHANWLRACYAYMEHTGFEGGTKRKRKLEEHLLMD